MKTSLVLVVSLFCCFADDPPPGPCKGNYINTINFVQQGGKVVLDNPVICVIALSTVTWQLQGLNKKFKIHFPNGHPFGKKHGGDFANGDASALAGGCSVKSKYYSPADGGCVYTFDAKYDNQPLADPKVVVISGGGPGLSKNALAVQNPRDQ